MDTSSARRIVVGFDGSHSSIAALHWAAIEAMSTGSTLELVMTWEWPVNCGWPQALVGSYNPEAIAREELETAEQRVREMHRDVDIHSRLVQGRPASALVEASWGAALLVVGSSERHSGFMGTLIWIGPKPLCRPCPLSSVGFPFRRAADAAASYHRGMKIHRAALASTRAPDPALDNGPS